MAILVRYEPPSLTREQYDRVNEILQGRDDTDSEGVQGGLEYHVLFGTEGQLKVSEIWGSEEQWQSFWSGALAPALEEVLGQEIPKPEPIEVHNTFQG